jgi:hypothetical protein
MPELGIIKVNHVQIGQILAIDEHNYLQGRNSVVQKTAGRKCSTRPLWYEQTTIEFRSQTRLWHWILQWNIIVLMQKRSLFKVEMNSTHDNAVYCIILRFYSLSLLYTVSYGLS